MSVVAERSPFEKVISPPVLTTHIRRATAAAAGRPSSFERITASGVGLTIGSIGGSTVRNITFRDCYMHRSYKVAELERKSNEIQGRGRFIQFTPVVDLQTKPKTVCLSSSSQGIYMKFRGDGLIADVTYENIYIEKPTQWCVTHHTTTIDILSYIQIHHSRASRQSLAGSRVVLSRANDERRRKSAAGK